MAKVGSRGRRADRRRLRSDANDLLSGHPHLRREIRLRGHRQGRARRLAIPCHDRAVGRDRSGCAGCGQHVPADRDLLLAGLRPPGIRAGAPPNPACASAAAAGADATGLRLCRHHLARHAVREHLAARRRDRFCRRRTRRAPSRAGANAGTGVVRLRRPAASECADRSTNPWRLHRLADADVMEAHGDPVGPGHGRMFRVGAGGLLRRARRDAATSLAFADGVRPRWHQPLQQTEPVSGHLERGRERVALEHLLPADPVGHLLADRAVRFRDAQGRRRGKTVRHAGDHRSLGACGHAASAGLSCASHGVHVEFPVG